PSLTLRARAPRSPSPKSRVDFDVLRPDVGGGGPGVGAAVTVQGGLELFQTGRVARDLQRQVVVALAALDAGPQPARAAGRHVNSPSHRVVALGALEFDAQRTVDRPGGGEGNRVVVLAALHFNARLRAGGHGPEFDAEVVGPLAAVQVQAQPARGDPLGEID